MQALQRLYLSHCSSPTSLPATISQLQAMTKLFLQHCVSMESLPVQMGKLRQLQALSITGCCQLASPPDFSVFTALKSVGLVQCGSLASLPTSITFLLLDQCDSTSLVPERFCRLTGLE